MNAFAILLDGDLAVSGRLRRQMAGRRVIAADGGIRHAATLAVEPELWLGDFDSVADALRTRWRDIPRAAYPGEKDQTDGELATLAARERGATDLLLAGAFGGPRADHAFLHAAHALQLAAQGLAVMLSDGRQEGYPLLAGEHVFSLPSGTLFSLVGFSALSGLTVEGARWPLSDRFVPFGSSLTLSNQVDGQLRIGLKSGMALLIATPEA